MVLQFLAMLPGIFSAISSATELFDAGKQVYADITGKEPPETVEALQSAVTELPADQQEAFASRMSKEIEMYQAQNARLEIQGGRVDAETLAALPPEAAAKVAILRMTTRPWCVRLFAKGMVYPVMSVFAVDIFLALVNSLIMGFWVVFGGDVPPVQFELIAGKFFAENSIYVRLYENFVPYAAAGVMTFMTLREFGKGGGPKQVAGNAVTGLINGIKSAVSGYRKG